MNKKDLSGIVCPETVHWKANHDNLKKRCALLSQRPDLPVDRIPAFQEMKRLQEMERKTVTLLNALNKIKDLTTIEYAVEIAEDALIQYELCQDPVCEMADQPHAHVEVILPQRVAQMSGDAVAWGKFSGSSNEPDAVFLTEKEAQADADNADQSAQFAGGYPNARVEPLVIASHPSNAAEPFAFYIDDEDGDRIYNGHNQFPGGRKGKPLYAAATVPQVVQAPIGYVDGVWLHGRNNGMTWNTRVFPKPTGDATYPLYAAPQPVAASPSIVPLGWTVRERRSPDGELIDCFVEGPKEGDMAYGLEVLGDDYTGYGDVERKLEHCKMIVAWANGTTASNAGEAAQEEKS